MRDSRDPRRGAAPPLPSSLPRGRRRYHRRALDVLVPDLADVEGLQVLRELLEGLVEAREGLALAGEGSRAREDEVLHVWVIDAALLELGHDPAERLVRLQHQGGPRLTVLEGPGEAPLEELVHPPQHGREGAAREALVLLVEQAEGDEVGRLELERVVLLAGVGLLLDQAAIHADDLEGFLLEVVRLLGVERQDLEGYLGLGDEDGRDHLDRSEERRV